MDPGQRGIVFLVALVIVPVNQGHIVRNQTRYIFLHNRFGVSIAFTVSCQPKRHVTGNQNHIIVVFPGYFKHSIHMAFENVNAFLITVNIQILATTKQLCLIHGDTNRSCCKALSAGGKHLINKFVCPLILTQQNIRCIMDSLILRPTENCGKMSQCVDGRNQFNTLRISISIHLFQLRLGIASSAKSKVWMSIHFIGIFHVQLCGVIAHHRNDIYPLFKSFHRNDCIARAVQIRTKPLKRNSLIYHSSYSS